MKDGNDLIATNKINRLAWPAIIAGISEPLISLADTAFIGRLGTSELAAVGIASSFYLMLVWILSQSLTAISAIVSQRLGSNKLDEIKSLVPQAMLSNILLGIGVILLTFPFSKTIFEFYEAKDNVLDFCSDYYQIRVFGFPFTLATMLLFGTFRGYQNTIWAMRISISGALLNLILDYVLIYGVSDTIPALGITGAAWASLISQVYMFSLAIFTLLSYTPFHLKLKRKINPAFKWLANMSFDLFIRTILLNLTFYLAIRFATGYGPEVIAAHTIAINIWLFSSFFIDGYAHAGNAISGTLKGGKNDNFIYPLGIRLAKISFFIGFGLTVIYLISYPFLGSIFSSDPAVIEAFNAIFWLVCLSQPVNAIAFVFDGIYKGLGETRLLRNLLVGATLLGFVPTALLFHQYYQSLMGIWIAFSIWMIIRALLLFQDFKKFKSVTHS